MSQAGKPKVFYGWFVVAASFAIALTLGEALWGFGVFFKPLENEFGWSRSVVSSSYTAFLIGYAASAIVAGRLSDRYGPRLVVLGIAVLSGLGLSLSGQVSNIDQLRVTMFVGGMGAGGTWSVPTSVVQRWFRGRKRAGLALSIVVCGVGVGGMVFAPLVNFLILSHGWRFTFLAVGILYFVILAAAGLVIREAPEGAGTDSTPRQSVLKNGVSQEWTTRRVVVTPPFIGVTFAIVSVVVAFQVVSVHLVPYATDAGISSTVSAAALGLMSGFSIPGRILSGIIADRIGWQKTMGLALVTMGLAVPLLFLPATSTLLYVFVFLYGLLQGLRAPAQLGILSQFFGLRSLGELIGITACAAQIAGAFAPYLGGYIFDTTGSYTLAFLLVIVVVVAGGITAMTLKEPVSCEQPGKVEI